MSPDWLNGPERPAAVVEWKPATEVAPREPGAIVAERPPEPTTLWSLLRASLAAEGAIITILPRRAADELRATFEYLAAKWRAETAMEPLQGRKAMNFAYQCIIGMGRDAVPLILESLSAELDDWFWALTAIAHENIAADTHTMAEAAEAWLQWGKANRYVA
jgi:hypothetical protein